MATLGLAVLPVAAAPPVSASLSLPAGFTILDYPTGQAAYNLTDFAWLDDGGLLTAGKDGTVTYVPPSGSPRTVATVPGVRAIGDHGLLGFAPANDYDTTGHVYLTYDKGDPAGTGFGMVEEWTMSPAANPTSFTRTRTLVDGSTMSPQLAESGATHSIDSVVVAPDDSLWVSVGENSNNNGDPHALRSQDVDEPYGKLLHLTPDGLGEPTNPFYSAASPGSWRSMVYVYGLRNPFRFSLDPRSGIPTLADVGWNTTEEVDTFSPGANGGWPCYEGNGRTTFSSYAVCRALYAADSVHLPIWTYPHDGAQASVVGGMFYTGASYPTTYRSSWFFGDYTRQELWTLATDTSGRLTRAPEAHGFAQDAGAPVSFHPGPNGDVTYADLAGGTVRRLVYSPGNRAPVAAFTTSNDPATRTVTFSAADSYDLDGDAITYAWDFGDGSTGSGQSVSHSYAADDPVAATLTVTDPLGAHDSSTSTVHPANHTPVLTLTTPSPRTYGVGDDVQLSASATDTEDGPLTITWRTVLRHCPFAGSCHLHPGDTSTGPTYDEPFTDHGSDTEMLVTAQATDSAGAVVSKTYVALPSLRTVAVNSPVAVAINGTTASTAQVVAGSDVEVNAPVSSSYWHFTRWSDNGAAAHSFTMPDADVTLSTTYTSAIASRYAAMGGAASSLGSPSGVEYDVAGGRARNFTGGRLYWSAATGARAVRGSILAKYIASGGPAALGFPATDEGAVGGGRASYFTRSRIYWGRATGAHVMRGAVLSRYLSAGGPTRYGLPTTDVADVPGGSYAHFSGGRSIFWSAGGGARLLYGAIRATYAAKGWQRSCLGFPSSEQFHIRHGVRERFAHGTITHRGGAKGRTTARCRRG